MFVRHVRRRGGLGGVPSRPCLSSDTNFLKRRPLEIVSTSPDMICSHINKNHPFYSCGNISLLEQSPMAVFCSREIPLSIYHTANEVFTEILKLPVAIAGGWQSAMEKRVLKNYKREGQANIIYFLAKGIEQFKLPAYLTLLMESEKLLIISPLLDKRRIEKRFVIMRDELILGFIKRFLFLYINPNGYLENIFNRCVSEDKTVYLLEHQANSRYFKEGVDPLSTRNLKEALAGRSTESKKMA